MHPSSNTENYDKTGIHKNDLLILKIKVIKPGYCFSKGCHGAGSFFFSSQTKMNVPLMSLEKMSSIYEIALRMKLYDGRVNVTVFK